MVEQEESLDALFAADPIGPAAGPDLSAAVAGFVQREPTDRVSCRRVHGSHYRCNWWSRADATAYDNPAMGGPTVATHRIRKSAFLHVTQTPVGLTIRVMQGLEDD